MGMKRLGLMFWDDTKYTKRLSVSPASLEPRPFWLCKKGVQTRSRLTSSLYIKGLSLHTDITVPQLSLMPALTSQNTFQITPRPL